MSKYLSIVIPCYNEQERIGRTLDALFSALPRCAKSWEIIVVDDGSTDRTWEVLYEYRRIYAHFIPLRVPHKGKGEAVRVGMLTAEGHFRLFMDADLSTSLREVPRALELAQKHEIVIGSRELDRSRVKTALHRRVMGRIFHAMIGDLVPDVTDTQCGFKLFRWDVARKLFRLQTVPGWAFDVEILYLARLAGYNIHEFPVEWTHDEGSKVRAVSASLEMLRDVIDIPMRHRGVIHQLGTPEKAMGAGKHRQK